MNIVPVTQLVESLTVNQEGVGSSPTGNALGVCLSRRRGTAVNRLPKGHVGANPTAPILPS